MRKQKNSTNLKEALWLNTLLTCIQFAIAILLNSSAVLADGFNNLRDSLTISVALTGNRLGHRHRKHARTIGASTAALNGLIIAFVIIATYIQAFEHIRNPSQHLAALPILISGILSIVINGRAAYLIHLDPHVASKIALVGLIASISGGACVTILGLLAQIGLAPALDGAIGVIIATISLIAALFSCLIKFPIRRHSRLGHS